MKIVGRSDADVDSAVFEEDYLTATSIRKFLQRLAQTDHDEQFLFRESEFDGAFRQIDMRLNRLTRESAPAASIATAQQVRDEIWRGHDAVAAHDTKTAIAALRAIEQLLASDRK